MNKTTIRKNGSKRVQKIITGKSMTDQSFQKDCDVNEIMRRFKKTGQITHLAKRSGEYLDVSDAPDLATALNTVSEAQFAFDNLPANVRKRFGNSPVEMFNYLQDPNNYEEALKLGLVKERTEVSSAATKRSAVVNKNKNAGTNDDDDLNDNDDQNQQNKKSK